VGWSQRLHCMNHCVLRAPAVCLRMGCVPGRRWEPACPEGGMDGIMDHD
jgi:hypothetical protein